MSNALSKFQEYVDALRDVSKDSGASKQVRMVYEAAKNGRPEFIPPDLTSTFNAFKDAGSRLLMLIKGKVQPASSVDVIEANKTAPPPSGAIVDDFNYWLRKK